MLEVRQSTPSTGRRRTCVSPLRAACVETPPRRPSVLGRRDLPSRGLPVKRCRVDTPSRRPPDHTRCVLPRDDVTDEEEEDWNKENRRPDCSRERAVTVGRRQRRRHVDFDVSDRCVESPANHVYHTLEPAASCRPAADTIASPVYETIKESHDVVDASAELGRSKLSSTCHLNTQQRPRDSSTLKTKKRVTFSVSVVSHRTICFYVAL